MDTYRVLLEAEGYGDALEDGTALKDALGALIGDDAATVAVSGRRMLMVVLTLPAADARDAHDEALELWAGAWERAFPDWPPTRRLVITCTPVEDQAVEPIAEAAEALT